MVFSPAVSALIGGAPPPASLLAAMDATGVQLTHIYGLTETYGPAAICEPQPSRRDLSDSERAARNARQGVHHALQAGMAVLTPGTNDAVPADGTTMGEIAFRGNMTMMGYLKDPAASDLAFEGGWFRSGDLAGRTSRPRKSRTCFTGTHRWPSPPSLHGLTTSGVKFRSPASSCAKAIAQPNRASSPIAKSISRTSSAPSRSSSSPSPRP